jgi:hypothetical protein
MARWIGKDEMKELSDARRSNGSLPESLTSAASASPR